MGSGNIGGGPGRPRDPGLDRAIRAATLELLGESGAGAMRLEDVATRATVGKASIYRRWTGKQPLILDAVNSVLPLVFSPGDRGSLEEDARALLVDVLRVLGGPLALPGRQLLPHLWSWPELADAYLHGVLAPWEAALRAVVKRAHARGETTDPDRTRTALQAAAATLVAEWLVRPAAPDQDRDRAIDQARAAELVYTLIRPTRTS